MGKIKKKPQIFVFTAPLPPKNFKLNLCEAARGEGLLYEDTPCGFDLGIERGGHSGGYWYCATVTETADGSEMRGKIAYRSFHGDGENRKNTKWEDLRDWLFIALLFLIFLIPILIFYAVEGIARLVGKLRGRPVRWTMTTAEKLTYFMTKTVGCREVK